MRSRKRQTRYRSDDESSNTSDSNNSTDDSFHEQLHRRGSSRPKVLNRLRMKEWLRVHLDSGDISGLSWYDKDHTLVKVSWKHGNRHEFDPAVDSFAFVQWAIYRGIFKDDEPKKKWKANFRSSMASLEDVKHEKALDKQSGNDQCRVYRFLPPGACKREKTFRQDDCSPVVFKNSKHRTSRKACTIRVRRTKPLFSAETFTSSDNSCSSPDASVGPSPVYYDLAGPEFSPTSFLLTGGLYEYDMMAGLEVLGLGELESDRLAHFAMDIDTNMDINNGNGLEPTTAEAFAELLNANDNSEDVNFDSIYDLIIRDSTQAGWQRETGMNDDVQDLSMEMNT